MHDTAIPPLRTLAVREGVGWRLVPVAEVVALLADGDGAAVVITRDGTYPVACSLTRLEERLPGGWFERISRRALVAVTQIDRVEPEDGGVLAVRLRNGVRIVASRQHSRRLRRELLTLG